MGVQFPDLQVLLPRADELARVGSPGQQQDVQQLALAQAAMAQQERDRSRVTRVRRTEAGARLRKGGSGDAAEAAARRLDGKGRHIDINA